MTLGAVFAHFFRVQGWDGGGHSGELSSSFWGAISQNRHHRDWRAEIWFKKINSIQQNLSNSLRFKRGCFLLLRLEIILFKREKMWTPILPFHHLAWLPPFQIYVFTQPENVVMIKNQIYNIDHLTGRSWSSNELANKSGDMTAWSRSISGSFRRGVAILWKPHRNHHN